MKPTPKSKYLAPLSVSLFFLALCSLILLFIAKHDRGRRSLSPENHSKVPLKPSVLGAFVQARGDAPNIKLKEPRLKPSQVLDFSNITAKSFLVYEPKSNAVLAQRAADERQPIASLTKLLTGLVIYEQADMAFSLTVNNEHPIETAPALGLKAGDKIKILDLFNAMLIGSANDAAMALADYVQTASGENFVALMNQKAKTLGMDDSRFSNALGFDSQNNFSTAGDLKKLVDETQKYAAFVDLGKKTLEEFESLNGSRYSIKASNKLIANHEEVESIKTGLTPRAEGALISKIAGQGGHKLIFIVLGSKNREQDTLNLASEIFAKFVWK